MRKRINKTATRIFCENNRDSFVVLAALLSRAIDGKLITKPRKKFSKKQLDNTTSKGRMIDVFLKSKNFCFPAQEENELMKRLEYIFYIFLLNDINIAREIEDIKGSLGFANSDNVHNTTLIDGITRQYQEKRNSELYQSRIKQYTQNEKDIEVAESHLVEILMKENEVLRQREYSLKKRLALLIRTNKAQIMAISQENESLIKENEELRLQNEQIQERSGATIKKNVELQRDFQILSEKVLLLQQRMSTDKK